MQGYRYSAEELKKVCSVEGCGRKPKARGLCSKHYKRLLANGKTELKTDQERFLEKVDKNGPVHPELGTRCWLWTASLCNRNLYGRFYFLTGPKLAHRVAYELFKGPITNDLTVDHICRVTHCVNPDHLQLLTHVENASQAIHPSSLRTTCIHGHPLNHIQPSGRRVCLTCTRIKATKQNARRRELKEANQR